MQPSPHVKARLVVGPSTYVHIYTALAYRMALVPDGTEPAQALREQAQELRDKAERLLREAADYEAAAQAPNP